MNTLFSHRSRNHITQTLLLLLIWTSIMERAIAIDSSAIAQSANSCLSKSVLDSKADSNLIDTILVSLLQGKILSSASKIIPDWNQQNQSIKNYIRQQKFFNYTIEKSLRTAFYHNLFSKYKSTGTQSTVSVIENPVSASFSDVSGSEYQSSSVSVDQIDSNSNIFLVTNCVNLP